MINVQNLVKCLPDELLRYISEGESSTLEFKLEVPPYATLARLIASFANSEGGILLIGIHDNGTVLGLSEDEVVTAVRRLHKVGDDLLPYPINVGTFTIEKKHIVYAFTEKAPEQFFPIMSPRGDYYKRENTQTIKKIYTSILSEYKKDLDNLSDISIPVIVFVAMSFHEEEEPALVDYYQGMTRAIKTTKLPIEVNRMDEIEGDYEISKKIMEEIDKADIVIADFTLNSHNVYFELGYARGKGCHVIQTARIDTKLKFDVRNWRTLFYRNATELEEKLKPEIVEGYKSVVEK